MDNMTNDAWALAFDDAEKKTTLSTNDNKIVLHQMTSDNETDDREMTDEEWKECLDAQEKWEKEKKHQTLNDEDYKIVCDKGFEAVTKIMYTCGL